MREHPRYVFKEKQSGPKLLHGNSDCGSAVTDPCCAEIPGMGQGPVKAKVRRKLHGRESPIRSTTCYSDVVSAACTPADRNIGATN